VLRRFFCPVSLVIAAAIVLALPTAAHPQSATYSTVYQFCSQANCTDGAGPESTMMQASDGNFYGATRFGGVGFGCFSDTDQPCGVVFRVSPAGQEAVIYNICDSTCGPVSLPADFVESGAGLLYGIANYGFDATQDTSDVFTFSPSGQVTSIGLPGPEASLTQGSDGDFYGTTAGGGITNSNCSNGCGTIFKLTPPAHSQLFMNSARTAAAPVPMAPFLTAGCCRARMETFMELPRKAASAMQVAKPLAAAPFSNLRRLGL